MKNDTNKSFMGMIAETAADNSRSVTENGALGHKTTGKALLDLNFGISSFRQKTDKDIEDAFLNAYAEDPALALKYLFFARDVRGGLGERRFFRVAASWLVGHHYDVFKQYLPLVPFYGRWDDLVELFFIKDATKDVEKIISDQLSSDWKNMKDEKSVSLLAKWLPSVNTSSKETVAKAQEIARRLKMTERQYRKMLSALRGYIEVVETKMSANEWDKIDYEDVPTKANILYKDAFVKHDEERRKKFLEALKKGEVKINATAGFPHDIVHSYYCKDYSLKTGDETLEAMWKALPTKTTKPILVVCDGSGSMGTRVDPNSSVTAHEIADSLAIYFAERLPEPFKYQYVTFSMNPQYVNLGSDTPLIEKLRIARSHNECANTNIEAVFDMVLDTAKKNNLKQEDIPDILVISDMEFDDCVSADTSDTDFWRVVKSPTKTLFQEIAGKYEAAGYKLPKLIFWNVASRTGTVPVRENDLGCALIGGFSTGNVDMVMSDKLDPYEILVDKLNTARYDLDAQLKNLVS